MADSTRQSGDAQLLANALREPIEDMILVEVHSQSQVDAIIQSASAMGRSPIIESLLWRSRSGQDVMQDIQTQINTPSIADKKNLLVVLRQARTTDGSLDREFWREMNLLREKWDSVPGQKLFVVFPQSYQYINEVALHLKSWFSLKLHLQREDYSSTIAPHSGANIPLDTLSQVEHLLNRAALSGTSRAEDAFQALQDVVSLPGAPVSSRGLAVLNRIILTARLLEWSERQSPFHDILLLPTAAEHQVLESLSMSYDQSIEHGGFTNRSIEQLVAGYVAIGQPERARLLAAQLGSIEQLRFDTKLALIELAVIAKDSTRVQSILLPIQNESLGQFWNGYLSLQAGDVSRAQSHFSQFGEFARHTDKLWIIGSLLVKSALAQANEELSLAESWCREAYGMARSTKSKQSELLAIDQLAHVLAQLGHIGEAQELVNREFHLLYELGGKRVSEILNSRLSKLFR